jgi:uncharacterized protein YdaU (DUF1376 family)
MAKDLFTPAWFPFYYGKFNSATQLFTAEAIGTYIILLNYQWDNGGLPNDVDELCVLTKSSQKSVEKVLAKFDLMEDGLLWNVRLEEIREEQHAKYLKSKEKADRANATIRMKKQIQPVPSTERTTLHTTERSTSEQRNVNDTQIDVDVDVEVNKEVKNNIYIESSRFVKPTEEQVAAYMVKYIEKKKLLPNVSALENQAEQYIAYYDKVGWLVGKAKNPMKSWQGAVVNWFNEKDLSLFSIKNNFDNIKQIASSAIGENEAWAFRVAKHNEENKKILIALLEKEGVVLIDSKFTHNG